MRGAHIDPEKIAALRWKLNDLKEQGHDVSELESYLDSGTITPEGVMTRLFALNRRLKSETDIPEVDASPAHAGEPEAAMDIVVASAAAAPAGAVEAKEGGEVAPGATTSEPEGGGEGGKNAAEEGGNGKAAGPENGSAKANGEEAGGAAGERPSGESVKKLKKVKKVAK
jgi:hypothetical protein